MKAVILSVLAAAVLLAGGVQARDYMGTGTERHLMEIDAQKSKHDAAFQEYENQMLEEKMRKMERDMELERQMHEDDMLIDIMFEKKRRRKY